MKDAKLLNNNSKIQLQNMIKKNYKKDWLNYKVELVSLKLVVPQKLKLVKLKIELLML